MEQNQQLQGRVKNTIQIIEDRLIQLKQTIQNLLMSLDQPNVLYADVLDQFSMITTHFVAIKSYIKDTSVSGGGVVEDLFKSSIIVPQGVYFTPNSDLQVKFK